MVGTTGCFPVFRCARRSSSSSFKSQPKGSASSAEPPTPQRVRVDSLQGAHSLPIITESAPIDHFVTPKKKKRSLQISTIVHVEEIRGMDMTPVGDLAKTFRYNCPLCMRFFNYMLQGSCCRQYICHGCAEALRDENARLPEARIRCPHCNSEPLKLKDVDPFEPTIHYSDSPMVGRSKSLNINYIPSPLKVGDSFEVMKAKLVTFQQACWKQTESNPSPISERTEEDSHSPDMKSNPSIQLAGGSASPCGISEADTSILQDNSRLTAAGESPTAHTDMGRQEQEEVEEDIQTEEDAGNDDVTVCDMSQTAHCFSFDIPSATDAAHNSLALTETVEVFTDLATVAPPVVL
eukprot:GILK01005346.1.p1 GENE.GILK01005346.1~~GILK01005346.1.p1  ORF type:complete len:350 (+),score=56.38 GILK01005346.1:104-1153(+)